MERQAFDRMAELDSTHWWYVARRHILASLIEREVRLPPDAEILEIGCGTGHNLKMLGRYGALEAVELDEDARALATKRLGRPVRAGRLLAAEFVNAGKSYRAVWYAGKPDKDGTKGGYYTPDGKNLRKAFLRSPLEFSRVSSSFGIRMHPIMQQWRAHKGIDYAAPSGTRVKATADGTVEFAGRQGGYGNVVVLKHQGGHSTYYAHLSRIGAGLNFGADGLHRRCL